MVQGIVDKDYTGEEVTQENLKVMDGEILLSEGVDYIVAYDGDRVNAGIVTVTITATGNYKESIVKTFEIKPLQLSSITFYENKIPNKTYNGSVIGLTERDVRELFEFKGAYLVLGNNFTVEYEQGQGRVNKGTYTVYFVGQGNWTGTVTSSFEILPRSLETEDIVIFSVSNITYTGSAIQPTPQVFDSISSRTLTDTDITYSYINNIKVAWNQGVVDRKSVV